MGAGLTFWAIQGRMKMFPFSIARFAPLTLIFRPVHPPHLKDTESLDGIQLASYSLSHLKPIRFEEDLYRPIQSSFHCLSVRVVAIILLVA